MMPQMLTAYRSGRLTTASRSRYSAVKMIVKPHSRMYRPVDHSACRCCTLSIITTRMLATIATTRIRSKLREGRVSWR